MKIIKHFTWSDWKSIGEQLDSYRAKRFEVFKSTNKNGLNRYKKVLVVGASCHPNEAEVTPSKITEQCANCGKKI